MWSGHRGGLERGAGKGLNLLAAASVVALALAGGSQPLWAEQPDLPGAAALPPGVALTSPSTALPPRPEPAYTPVPPGALTQTLPPVTDNAGMGTGDVPRPAAPVPTVASGVDAAGNDAPATATAPTAPKPAPALAGDAPAITPSATSPAVTASGIDAAGNGPATPAAPAVEAAPALAGAAPDAPAGSSAQATPPAITASGVDASGNGSPVAAPAVVATPTTAPIPLATSATAGAEAPAAPPAAAPVVAAPVAPIESTPAVAAAPVDPMQPVASEVLTLVARPDALTSSKKDQEALSAFYGARQGMPVFVAQDGFNVRGKAVLARLAAAGEDGLDPEDYATPTLAGGADAQALARAEMQLAAAALTYARQAQSGRFTPSRISSLVTPTREIPDPKTVLETLADASDANAMLQGFNPPHAGYKALRGKLAAMTAAEQAAPKVVSIPEGPLLRPGKSDPRVPILRTRLGLPDAGMDETYDPELVDAVKDFQRSAGLNSEGIVGPATVAALNKDGRHEVTTRADVIANMERWRWLPRNLGAQHVMVNIPEYMARVFDDGKVIFETRIVAGKPQTPTPLLSHDMEYVVVNPAWNIPPSIARNEMMPLLRNNPSALSRRGIEVTRTRGGGYSFRQVPGANNALGRIKFMFPNDHSVYLHDTPSRSLFANSRRAFSHGCMRLQDPLMFGEVIFGIGLPDSGITKTRLGKMLGTSERYINLKNHIPVHVVYFTTFVNEKGELESREDIYGINAQVKSLLGLDGRRRIADGTSSRKR